MEQRKPEKDYFETHHLLILGCYTVFAVLLIGEALLLNWEVWALILIAISVCICWTLHIRQLLSEHTRVWIYAILMMVSIFFYGTHVTSTYDLGLLMTVLILIFVSTGIPGLITLGQCTYYLAMVYDLISLYRMGEKFDRLLIIRTLLHFVIMTVICLIARNIIRQWVGIMEKSEEEKQVMSEAADRLNDFLANISHEIRTPVNAVIGLTRICIDKVKDRETKRNLMSVMQAGQKIGDQISDILDYSEVDMGSLAVNEEDYMITSLLHDIVAELSPLKRQDLELVIDVDPRIPATMRSDVTKLKKIIRHLIDNALKYTDEGGVYVHFTPEEREYGINLLIEVTDTGIGMTGAELEKVFERFYQADSGRSRAANGLGLGLSIVNGFTRSLNGFLKIDSEPQVGTTIRVSIPQKVVGNEYCMSIQDPDKLSLGAYLHLEKFRNPHVRAFYNSMVKDMVLGLKVKMQRADNMAGFKKLAQATRFTHVFVGQQEYEEDSEFMKELAKTVMVAVICDASFEIPDNPGIRLMRKPFYCVPVISFVNTNRSDLGKVKGRLYARGVRALVVDDENMNLLVARQIFSGYGMKVSTVSSGPEAIEYVRNHEVDLVLMDHMMPGMHGVEATTRIRGVYSK
jgi:signal transduction histidine kinase